MEHTATAVHREPWNKGKIVGQKAPFKIKGIWTLRNGNAKRASAVVAVANPPSRV